MRPVGAMIPMISALPFSPKRSGLASNMKNPVLFRHALTPGICLIAFNRPLTIFVSGLALNYPPP